MPVVSWLMYLRFAVLQHDPESHLPRGLFIASDDMMERAELESYEHAQLQSLLEWFIIANICWCPNV